MIAEKGEYALIQREAECRVCHGEPVWIRIKGMELHLQLLWVWKIPEAVSGLKPCPKPLMISGQEQTGITFSHERLFRDFATLLKDGLLEDDADEAYEYIGRYSGIIRERSGGFGA